MIHLKVEADRYPPQPGAPGPAFSDAELERRIECERVAMMYAADEHERRHHFQQMRELIGQRSPGQIARMEARIKGLR